MSSATISSPFVPFFSVGPLTPADFSSISQILLVRSFYLTARLLSTDGTLPPQLPSLRASYAANGVPPRVVQTSSAGHALAPGTGFEESIIYGGVKRVEQMKKWGSTRAKWAAYGMSKAGNIFVANILQDELKEEGVSMSVHPGVLKSELWRCVASSSPLFSPFLPSFPLSVSLATYLSSARSSPSWQMLFMNWALHPSSQGALTQLWGATSPEGAKFGRKVRLPPFSRRSSQRADDNGAV